MTSDLVARNARRSAEEALADTPVVVLSGARQVGKSTLLRELIADRPARHVTLDSAAALGAARADPESFVEQAGADVLAIDEIQRAPELLLAIKRSVDENRAPGRFLVTGSADLLQVRGAQESLAGRAETVPMFGLSQGEIAGSRDDFASRIWSGDLAAASPPSMRKRDYLDAVCVGGYPEARRRTPARRARWFEGYLGRILSKDAPEISGIQYPDRLERIVRLIAANNSGELVAARIARDADLPERSLPAYLKVLEDLFLVRTIPAWGDNLTKRVVGRPKVSLLDTGLAAHLVNVDGDALLASPDASGGLLESFVYGELLKQRTWSRIPYSIGHFRDRNGREVDLVLEDRSRRVVGVEVKATSSIDRSAFGGLELLRNALGDRFVGGVVLYTGGELLPFGDRLWAAPVSAVWD